MAAYNLRVDGASLYEIATAIGVTDYKQVVQLLRKRFEFEAGYLTEADRESIMALEMARLDKLQQAVWPEAMSGEPKAVDSAVRIILARARISGLERIDPVVQKNLVLVMGEKEEDYIAALKAVSDD